MKKLILIILISLPLLFSIGVAQAHGQDGLTPSVEFASTKSITI